MLQHHSVEAELTQLAAQAQATPLATPKPLTPSQLAVLAAGLGRKHGVKVVFGDSRTAQTDGQTVVMPLTSKENSWIVRGYLDHEVGHVRLTNLNVIPQDSPLHRSLWNILEDIRIERAMANLYPGTATNLRALLSQLRKAEPGIFELEPGAAPEATITAYIGLMLRSLYLGQPEIADLAQKTREQFLKTFGPDLERDLFALISDIETAASTEDVVALVGRIVDLLKQRAGEKPPEPEPEQQEAKPQDDSQQQSGEDQPDSGNEGQQESDSPGDSSQQESDSESGSSGDAGDDADGQAESGPGDADGDRTEPASSPGNATSDAVDAADGAGDGAGTVSGDDEPPADPVREAVIQALESQEEQADLGDQLKALVQEREADLGIDPNTIKIAKPTRQSTLPNYGYRKHPVKPSTSVVAKLSARLRGLLQAQALDHAKPSAAGSRIARSRLHRIRTGESRLFLRNDQVRQVNTAIHLLVDNSGSMSSGDRFPITRDVVMALVKALSPIRGVNMGVTIFPAYCRASISDPYTGVAIPQVDPVLSHGQKPGPSLLWPSSSRGGTPLAESLRYVLAEMLKLPEPRKIVVILTDGEPNDHIGSEMAIREAADLKIEVATLGIEDVKFPELFPHFEIVNNVRELPEKAFRLLEKLLLT